MKYLLDTNVVSKLYDRSAEGHRRIGERLAKLGDTDDVAISILTVYELEFGLVNAPVAMRTAVREKIDSARNAFRALPLFVEGAPVFGELKKALKERRALNKEAVQRHNVDLLLAATCVVDERVLVSVDAIYGDLQAIEPGLRTENWLA